MAVQGRMIGLVHRDFEPADSPFNHVCPQDMLSRDNTIGKGQMKEKKENAD
jgi:hypothetical protein